MKVRDLLNVLDVGIPHLRFIDSNKFLNMKLHIQRPDEAVIECVYLDKTPLYKGTVEKYLEMEVMHFCVIHEVSHKQHKELGLLPPYKESLTAEYVFKDIQQKTFYDIYINYVEKENFNV